MFWRAPSRRCTDARAYGRPCGYYGHAWHEYTPPLQNWQEVSVGSRCVHDRACAVSLLEGFHRDVRLLPILLEARGQAQIRSGGQAQVRSGRQSQTRSGGQKTPSSFAHRIVQHGIVSPRGPYRRRAERLWLTVTSRPRAQNFPAEEKLKGRYFPIISHRACTLLSPGRRFSFHCYTPGFSS